MKDLSKYLTIYQIAEKTGHSVPGIHYAIRRHKIKPAYITHARVRLFPPSVVDTIKQKMRKPRRRIAA